jgi:hypothetical protein
MIKALQYMTRKNMNSTCSPPPKHCTQKREMKLKGSDQWEKGELCRWQMLATGLALWWPMVFCLGIWPPSWKISVSFSLLTFLFFFIMHQYVGAANHLKLNVKVLQTKKITNLKICNDVSVSSPIGGTGKIPTVHILVLTSLARIYVVQLCQLHY